MGLENARERNNVRDPDAVGQCRVCNCKTYADEQPHICQDCYGVLRDSLQRQPDSRTHSVPPAYRQQVADKIALYTERAAAGLPLFD